MPVRRAKATKNGRVDTSEFINACACMSCACTTRACMAYLLRRPRPLRRRRRAAAASKRRGHTLFKDHVIWDRLNLSTKRMDKKLNAMHFGRANGQCNHGSCTSSSSSSRRANSADSSAVQLGKKGFGQESVDCGCNEGKPGAVPALTRTVGVILLRKHGPHRGPPPPHQTAARAHCPPCVDC